MHRDPLKNHGLTFRFVYDLTAKTFSAFEDNPLSVFARSQVGERFFDNCPAVQQALILCRVYANCLERGRLFEGRRRRLSGFEQSLLSWYMRSLARSR